MRKSILCFAFLTSVTQAHASQEGDLLKKCGHLLTGQSPGPSVTTMSLPRAGSITSVLNQAASEAASSYGENVDLIRAALIDSLSSRNIPLEQIHNIGYDGALESNPPQHMFKITLIDGSVHAVYAVASSYSYVVSPSQVALPAPPATTLPLPRARDISSVIVNAVSVAATAYGEDPDRLRQSLIVFIAMELNITRIHNIEYGGATKSREDQPLFIVTTSDGTVEEIYADGYLEGMTPPMVRLGTFPDLVLRKNMSRPLTQNIDQMVDHVVTLAASQYGQDASRIRDGLLYKLSIAKIELRDIHSIEYNGALESMPPQHRFIVTTKTNGTTVIYSP